jgi:hypothetical protein
MPFLMLLCFLQVLEAAANVFVGLVGLVLTQGGPSPNIPYGGFAVSQIVDSSQGHRDVHFQSCYQLTLKGAPSRKFTSFQT